MLVQVRALPISWVVGPSLAGDRPTARLAPSMGLGQSLAENRPNADPDISGHNAFIDQEHDCLILCETAQGIKLAVRSLARSCWAQGANCSDLHGGVAACKPEQLQIPKWADRSGGMCLLLASMCYDVCLCLPAGRPATPSMMAFQKQ